MDTVIDCVVVNLFWLSSMENFNGSVAANAATHRQHSATHTISPIKIRRFIVAYGQPRRPPPSDFGSDLCFPRAEAPLKI